MFQNIAGQVGTEESEEMEEKRKSKIVWNTIFSKQKIAIYLITFMLSTIDCLNGIAPFAIAIFAACCSNKIPTMIVFILTLLGTLIGLGSEATLTYLLTSIVFIVMMLVRKPVEQEEYENEKLRLGTYVFLASFVVQISKMLLGNFMIYDLLSSVMVGISSYIFYKIFSNSLIVIHEFGIKKAFAMEEVIGASIMIAITASAFRGIAIFGFEIRTILSILIVLILGWKNGVLVGATTGITIGTVLGIIGQAQPIMIASFALSGMIAGIFSRFGKPGVIVGFLLGNAVLTYVTNGNTTAIIYVKEILIASLGLLLVPKTIQIDIEELIGKTKFFPTTPVHQLEENKETIHKLNTMSETIQEMAQTYKEVAATVVDEEEEIEEQNKSIFQEELMSNLEMINLENILYEDLQIIDRTGILTDMYQVLRREEELTRKDLLEIFAKHNNYIIGFDDVQVSMKLEKDIREVMKVVNDSYKISKLNFIWKQKIEENKKNISNQLDGVSKVISSLAEEMKEENDTKEKFRIEKEEIKVICKEKNIPLEEIKIKQEKTGRMVITTYLESCHKEQAAECHIVKLEKILSKIFNEKIVLQNEECGAKLGNSLCVNTFISEDKYLLQIGIAKATKENSPISGDSNLTIKLKDGKYLLAISDGMGSGPKARQSSQIATKMLERMLTTGFDKDTSLELINSTLSLNTEEDYYATLDVAILDLYAGNIEFIKNGACPTYIKHNKETQIIKALSLPAGILENINLVVYDKDLENQDIMVMCSDGIMESNTEYQNKELWVKNILEEIATDNVQKIADIILKESIDNGFGVAKDDMTIITTKFIKKEH